MTEFAKIHGWKDNLAWDRILLDNSGRLLVQTQGGDSITNYALETTQLSVLSNISSIKNNTSDTAINTLAIGNDTTNINSNVDIIKQDIKLLKKEEVEYINYELETLGPTLWQDSVNDYIRDPLIYREGWYYVNSPNVGGSNLYWYSSDAPYSFRGNSNLSLLNMTVSGGFYVVMYIDKVNLQNVLPIFAIFTTPTGTGDASPGFYKSRLTYRPSQAEKLYSGELVVLYNNTPILDKIKNIYPNARRVQLSQDGLDGQGLTTENIRFLSINGNSGSALDTQQWLINSAGWYDGFNTVNHYKFTTEPETTNITNYALETTQLSILNNVSSILTNDINTRINSVLNIGSYNNVNNNTDILPDELSTLTADISNMRTATIVYTDTSTDSFDSVGIEVSADGVNYHEIGGVFPFAASGAVVRSGFTNLTVGGFTLLRIRNKSIVNVYANVECSVYGSP